MRQTPRMEDAVDAAKPDIKLLDPVDRKDSASPGKVQIEVSELAAAFIYAMTERVPVQGLTVEYSMELRTAVRAAVEKPKLAAILSQKFGM